MDGLAGNFIVREPEGRNPNSNLYDFDLPSHVMLIMDWYYLDADQHFPGLLGHDKSQDANAYLIGGRGRNVVSSQILSHFRDIDCSSTVTKLYINLDRLLYCAYFLY
jgi:hypothetical protein